MGIAVVTGAASGIGRALARRLATRGHQVHLVDVAATADLAAELAGVGHTADVASAEDMERVACSAEEAEIVCLNAGIVGASLGVPWEVPVLEWQRMWAVNVLGWSTGCRLSPLGCPRRRGQILITGSLAGLVTFPGGGAYAATKHAVVALAESASLALQGTSVTVTLACPALVRTGMSEVGADPDHVAAEALAAADDGRFLVVPSEWTPAVVSRAEHLVSGAAPVALTPSGDSAG